MQIRERTGTPILKKKGRGHEQANKDTGDVQNYYSNGKKKEISTDVYSLDWQQSWEVLSTGQG